MSLSRRHAFGALGCMFCAVAVTPPRPADAAGGVPKTDLTPDQALARLMYGNRRFVADQPIQPDIGSARRRALSAGQAPYATIVACADSRSAPETLVGAGLGEIFVTRVAGNTVPAPDLASIAYAVDVLGTPLIAVLGHESCGAVAAAVAVVTQGLVVPPIMQPMLGPLIFAVNAVRNQPGDLLDNAVRENARQGARQLSRQPEFAEKIAAGKLKIVAARYDLDEGQITLLDT
ncbi:MAG: carbonic anhydrase [Alphaproteobacteria bacterium]|nr:carbonic anhydrase [Alphaproteobacteria bacterium]